MQRLVALSGVMFLDTHARRFSCKYDDSLTLKILSENIAVRYKTRRSIKQITHMKDELFPTSPFNEHHLS